MVMRAWTLAVTTMIAAHACGRIGFESRGGGGPADDTTTGDGATGDGVTGDGAAGVCGWKECNLGFVACCVGTTTSCVASASCAGATYECANTPVAAHCASGKKCCAGATGGSRCVNINTLCVQPL